MRGGLLPLFPRPLAAKGEGGKNDLCLFFSPKYLVSFWGGGGLVLPPPRERGGNSLSFSPKGEIRGLALPQREGHFQGKWIRLDPQGKGPAGDLSVVRRGGRGGNFLTIRKEGRGGGKNPPSGGTGASCGGGRKHSIVGGKRSAPLLRCRQKEGEGLHFLKGEFAVQKGGRQGAVRERKKKGGGLPYFNKKGKRGNLKVGGSQSEERRPFY